MHCPSGSCITLPFKPLSLNRPSRSRCRRGVRGSRNSNGRDHRGSICCVSDSGIILPFESVSRDRPSKATMQGRGDRMVESCTLMLVLFFLSLLLHCISALSSSLSLLPPSPLYQSRWLQRSFNPYFPTPKLHLPVVHRFLQQADVSTNSPAARSDDAKPIEMRVKPLIFYITTRLIASVLQYCSPPCLSFHLIWCDAVHPLEMHPLDDGIGT